MQWWFLEEMDHMFGEKFLNVGILWSIKLYENQKWDHPSFGLITGLV